MYSMHKRYQGTGRFSVRCQVFLKLLENWLKWPVLKWDRLDDYTHLRSKVTTAQMSMVASLVDRKVFIIWIYFQNIYKNLAEQHLVTEVKPLLCVWACLQIFLCSGVTKSFPQRPDPSNPLCCGSDALLPGFYLCICVFVLVLQLSVAIIAN